MRTQAEEGERKLILLTPGPQASHLQNGKASHLPCRSSRLWYLVTAAMANSYREKHMRNSQPFLPFQLWLDLQGQKLSKELCLLSRMALAKNTRASL